MQASMLTPRAGVQTPFDAFASPTYCCLLCAVNSMRAGRAGAYCIPPACWTPRSPFWGRHLAALPRAGVNLRAVTCCRPSAVSM